MTAPRITRDHVEEMVEHEHYHVPPDTTLTLCVLTLKNGFTVTGESACAAAENFDAELGRQIARENAIQKVWMFEGYLLRDLLAAGEQNSITITDTFIAKVAHEVNRAYCAHIGDGSQPAWDDAPDWQVESALAGVRAVAQDPSITPEQSHHNWCEAKRKAGWVWGPVKDPEAKEHPCLTPFENLPREQQLKDHLFTAVAKAMLGPAAPGQRMHVQFSTEETADG